MTPSRHGHLQLTIVGHDMARNDLTEVERQRRRRLPSNVHVDSRPGRVHVRNPPRRPFATSLELVLQVVVFGVFGVSPQDKQERRQSQ
jgi:hypothetical protein